MSNYKIVIDFSFENGVLTNVATFENNPSVLEVFSVLESNFESFKKIMLEEASKEGVKDEELYDFIKELKVNDLS